MRSNQVRCGKSCVVMQGCEGSGQFMPEVPSAMPQAYPDPGFCPEQPRIEFRIGPPHSFLKRPVRLARIVPTGGFEKMFTPSGWKVQRIRDLTHLLIHMLGMLGDGQRNR